MYAMSQRLAMFLILFAHTAAAGDVAISVTAEGKPLAGAVAMLRTAAAPPGPIRFAEPPRMMQQDIAFSPHVLIVPVSAEVEFPNLDRVRHHVFSFSPVKRFELKLYGREEARTIRFDTPGVVPIGCNIHDRMSAFIVVSDTPYAAQTDAGGAVHWDRVARGAATLTLWHPRLRAPKNQITIALDIPAGAPVARTFEVELRAVAR